MVFSDTSLAFGVNMPFRTTVFYGDDPDLLTPLMAAQMSGTTYLHTSHAALWTSLCLCPFPPPPPPSHPPSLPFPPASGRAGRRGLDTQGHLVYLGMPFKRIQELMLGCIPAIIGEDPK